MGGFTLAHALFQLGFHALKRRLGFAGGGGQVAVGLLQLLRTHSLLFGQLFYVQINKLKLHCQRQGIFGFVGFKIAAQGGISGLYFAGKIGRIEGRSTQLTLAAGKGKDLVSLAVANDIAVAQQADKGLAAILAAHFLNQPLFGNPSLAQIGLKLLGAELAVDLE